MNQLRRLMMIAPLSMLRLYMELQPPRHRVAAADSRASECEG